MVTGPSDESFLPQIVGIFYAVFDPHRGPIVPYQVPENLISQPEDPARLGPVATTTTGNTSHPATGQVSRFHTPPVAQTPTRSISASPCRTPSRLSKRAASSSPNSKFRSQSRHSSHSAAHSSHSLPPYNIAPLLEPAKIDFLSISEYIIPKGHLKHRLITCCSGGYKIIGFPCFIEDAKYERNEFIFNFAFVFDRLSDLSAFEPVVRKCGRIMRACELDTQWMSSNNTKHMVQSLLEQLLGDLNSYSETSIVLDGINSLDLSLFPFYANPPPVHDWHVPVALVDFERLKDASWDLTAAKITGFINGVHHVGRIAQLADADLETVRLCIQHFLFYQVIIMIDIFQFSNMYTCKPAIARRAKDRSVIDECGRYVTKQGRPEPSWPVLALLYSQFKPGLTVHEWMEMNELQARDLDVRRFVTFGVIKGFLRRVHRWPIHLDKVMPAATETKTEKDGEANSSITAGEQTIYQGGASASTDERTLNNTLGRPRDSKHVMASSGPKSSTVTTTGRTTDTSNNFALKANMSADSLGTSPNFGGGIWKAKSQSQSPGGNNNNDHGSVEQVTPVINRWNAGSTSKSPGYFQPQLQTVSSSFKSNRGFVPSSQYTNHSVQRVAAAAPSSTNSIHGASLGLPNQRPGGYQHRGSRDNRFRSGVKTPALVSHLEQEANLEASLLELMNGLHHTDEMQVRFKMGWAKLDQHLRRIAGLPRDLTPLDEERKEQVARGDYGDIVIVLR